MPLTRQQLDTMQCGTPGCTEEHGALYFHGRCHPNAATWAGYADGVVTVRCSVCEQTIVAIAVAERK